MSGYNCDQTLVKRAQCGDRRAFGELVKRHQRRLRLSLRRFLSLSSDIDDVMQESFIRAYRALENFRGECLFSTWMHRIVINTALNHHKARTRELSTIAFTDADYTVFFERPEELKDLSTPDSILESKQTAIEVAFALENMPTDFRTALLLHEVDGLSYDEIAKQMACPVGTVRSRINRARTTLGLALGDVS
jgi:RNA polymerase sigma factor RpoE